MNAWGNQFRLAGLPAKTRAISRQNIPIFSEVFRFSGLPSARKTLSNFVRFCHIRLPSRFSPPPVAFTYPRPAFRRLRPGGPPPVHSAARPPVHSLCPAGRSLARPRPAQRTICLWLASHPEIQAAARTGADSVRDTCLVCHIRQTLTALISRNAHGPRPALDADHRPAAFALLPLRLCFRHGFCLRQGFLLGLGQLRPQHLKFCCLLCFHSFCHLSCSFFRLVPLRGINF